MNLEKKILRRLLLIGLLAVSVSCTKKLDQEKTLSSLKETAAEVFMAEPFLVRVQDGESSKVISLNFKYSGEKGFTKDVESQKDVVQNLVIATLSDYDLTKLKTRRGKEKFQKSILTSLNEFVAENKFTKVELVELKEI